MKKFVSVFVLSILVLYILLCPQAAISAASYGLVLWYTTLLPTLLPFAILSYIFITTGVLNSFAAFLHKGIHKIIPISPAGIYPLVAGFLFGFPLGSHIAALLVEQDQLDYQEGNRLFAISNNISPVFISGFILNTSLKRPDLTAITIFILYLPPILYYIANTKLQLHHTDTYGSITKKAAPRSQINFKIIDAGIMSGFETLTKLGGYIMLFAIFSQMTTCIPVKNDLIHCILTALMEITNGISCISAASFSFEVKYILIIICTALGGFSGLAQTTSMVKEAGFRMKDYMKTKIICSLTSAILAFLAIRLHIL